VLNDKRIIKKHEFAGIIFFGGAGNLGGFEIDCTGTNEGAENKIRTAKSVNNLICLKFV